MTDYTLRSLAARLLELAEENGDVPIRGNDGADEGAIKLYSMVGGKYYYLEIAIPSEDEEED